MGFAHRTTILEVIDEVNRRLQTGSKKDYFDDPVIMITKNEKRSFLELMDTKLYTKVRPSTPLKDVPLEALPILFEVMKRRDVSRLAPQSLFRRGRSISRTLQSSLKRFLIVTSVTLAAYAISFCVTLSPTILDAV